MQGEHTYGDTRVPARLWAKVQPDEASGCWTWTGARFGSNYNYGAAWFDGKTLGAHRVFYLLLVRRPADDEHVHHECRNTLCVNPAHIAALSVEEHSGHGHSDKTHCPHGHEYTPQNTKTTYRYTVKGTLSPNRQCRTCIKNRYIQRKGR